MPFIGASGAMLRGMVNSAGIRPDDCRINNAIPYRVVVPGNTAAVDKLISEHNDHLEDDLVRSRPRAILAVGGVALRRLLGMTAAGGINVWTGAAVEWSHPSWGGHRAVVIPCVHPAAVMRTKLQAERRLIATAVRRAVRYATGELTYVAPQPRIVHNPDDGWLLEYFAACDWIAVDTEFGRDDRNLQSVQLACEPGVAVVIDQWMRCRYELQEVLIGPAIKVAHNHVVDVDSLMRAGIDVTGPWYDTMGAHSALYPDLSQGLSHVTRLYCDNAWPWKSLDTMDVTYRALDVHFLARVYLAQRDEVASAMMTEVVFDETMPALPLLWGMTERGLQVDATARDEYQRELESERDALRVTLVEQAGATFGQRAGGAREVEATLTADIVAVRASVTPAVGRCEIHPTYDGMRGKKFTAGDSKDKRGRVCTCSVLYDALAGVRQEVAALRSSRTKVVTKARRWEKRGFDPGNNDHLRWLLYDKSALGLPKQYHDGSVTANATAIAKLTMLLRTRPPGVKVGNVLPDDRETVATMLEGVKRYQHVVHMRESFAEPPVDDRDVAHPPMRIATGTGRVAGGDDNTADDVKSGSKYSFNVLNIPDESRGIYVPHAAPLSPPRPVTTTP